MQSGHLMPFGSPCSLTPTRRAYDLNLWDPPWSRRSTAGATSECTRQRCSSSISMQAVNVGADPLSRTVFWAPRLRASSSPRVTLQVGCGRRSVLHGQWKLRAASQWLMRDGRGRRLPQPLVAPSHDAGSVQSWMAMQCQGACSELLQPWQRCKTLCTGNLLQRAHFLSMAHFEGQHASHLSVWRHP